MGDYHVRFCERLGLKCPCLLDYAQFYGGIPLVLLMDLVIKAYGIL